MRLALILLLFPAGGATLTLDQLLSRVTEEAETLRQNARLVLTEETLQQRSVHVPSRFRLRAGQSALNEPKPTFKTREIVSEYSIGIMGSGETERLLEFRQVISVDGKPYQTAEKARHALSLGLNSNEDKGRKRMLEDFEHHGLVGAVSDFGTLLLQFTKRGIRDLKINALGGAMIGPDPVTVLEYRQVSGAAGVLDFHNRKVQRIPLQGLLLVRASDGFPLRITVAIRRMEDQHQYDDEGTVDYVMTAHGFAGPASVVHRGYADKQLTIENHFTYAPFRRFGAEAEIKFTEIPDPPPPSSKP